MRIRPVHLVSVVLGVAVLGAGPCGGAGQSADTGKLQGAEKDVAQAVYDFRDAVTKGDESKICDTYFTADLAKKVAADGKAAGRGDTCKDVIQDSIADIDATDIKVKDVSVDGTTATATITTNLSKGPDGCNKLTLVNADQRGWRISDLSSPSC